MAREAGLLGVRRVLDSTPLYDAVATMDTVTLVRSAIRGLLAVSGDREPALRALLRRDDDYRSAGKPSIDWDDLAAREVDREVVLGEAAVRSARRLDLAVADGIVRVERLEDGTGTGPSPSPAGMAHGLPETGWFLRIIAPCPDLRKWLERSG